MDTHTRVTIEDLHKVEGKANFPHLTVLPEEYADARRQAADALALPLATLAEACPWGMDEILDGDFFPEQL